MPPTIEPPVVAATPNPSGEPAGHTTADAFAAIDAMAAGDAPVTPEPEGDEPADPSVNPADKGIKPAEKKEPAEAPKTPPADPKKVADEAKPPKAASLREAKDRAEAQLKEWKTKFEALQKEHSTPKEDAEKKKLLEERDSWGKSKQQLENELRYAKYERTQEFKDKYQVPFENSYKEGVELVKSFTYKEPDRKDENDVVVEGKSRKATQDDWDTFIGLDANEANKFAHEHFGYNAQEMIVARRDLFKLLKSKNEAITKFQTEGAQMEQKQLEQQQTQEKEFKQLFESSNKAAVDDPKLARWFKADEADAKAKELLDKGFNFADEAFSDATAKKPLAERARVYSILRNKAAAFDHVAYKLSMTEKRNAELQKALDEYEASEPNLDGKGGRKVKEGKVEGLSAVDAAIDKMANG